MSVDGRIAPSRFGDAGRARSFTWRHLFFRLAWNIVWRLFASWTPPQLYAWRRFLLNLFGARIAKGARVYGSARIWYPPNVTMGRGSVLGPGVNCYSMGRITIEDFGEVAQLGQLVTGTHEIDSPGFDLYWKPIVISSHAWIASSAFVGPGVTVGEGAVLGACAVAFKDLEPWTVYAGNPAQKIKQRRRFDADDGASVEIIA